MPPNFCETHQVDLTIDGFCMACQYERTTPPRERPFDKDTLHMLGGRAMSAAKAGLRTTSIETEYLAELVRVARSVVFPAFQSTKQ